MEAKDEDASTQLGGYSATRLQRVVYQPANKTKKARRITPARPSLGQPPFQAVGPFPLRVCLDRHRCRGTAEVARAGRAIRAGARPVGLACGQIADRHPDLGRETAIFPRTIGAGRALDAVVERVG